MKSCSYNLNNTTYAILVIMALWSAEHHAIAVESFLRIVIIL